MDELIDGETPSLPKSDATDDSQVSLPASVASSTLIPEKSSGNTGCCKRNCHTLFESSCLENYKLEIGQGEFDEVQTRKFEKLKLVFNANPPEKQKKGLCWTFMQKTVCRKFWESLHSLSPGRVDQLLHLLRQGHMVLPKPKPRMAKPEPIYEKVSLWFLEVYQFLADPLAIPGSEIGCRCLMGRSPL